MLNRHLLAEQRHHSPREHAGKQERARYALFLIPTSLFTQTRKRGAPPPPASSSSSCEQLASWTDRGALKLRLNLNRTRNLLIGDTEPRVNIDPDDRRGKIDRNTERREAEVERCDVQGHGELTVNHSLHFKKH